AGYVTGEITVGMATHTRPRACFYKLMGNRSDNRADKRIAMSIQVKNIKKQFGKFTALNDVSLDFPTGELVALLGPSGCGKTTLLRIIAGLEQADEGRVEFYGEDATGVHVRQRQ